MSDKNILAVEELRKTVGLNISEFDSELKKLEEAAIKKMELSGIHPKKIIKEDGLIVTTISAYIKANFRFTDTNLALRFQQVFEENKNYMSSTKEYTENGDVNG